MTARGGACGESFSPGRKAARAMSAMTIYRSESASARYDEGQAISPGRLGNVAYPRRWRLDRRNLCLPRLRRGNGPRRARGG